MLRFILPILLVAVSFSAITAQDFSFTAKKYSHPVESSLDAKFKDYQIFQFNTDDLESHIRQTDGNTEITLHFGEVHKWDLDLLNSNLFADNYILLDGKKTLSNQRPVPMTGYLLGANNERVALTVSEDFIYGFIEEAGKTYYIEPLRYFTPNQEENLFVIYEESNVIKDNTIKCGVTEKHHRGQHLENQYKAESTTDEKSILACKLLELAIASDFFMFQSYGSVVAVEAHNVGVMNNVATDYDDSFNDEIQFEIVEQFVPSTAATDPISTSLDIGTILDEFTAWGPTGFANTHDLGQHWSARDYSTTTIGLAWVGVVCGGFRYHVLEDFSSTAWALRVLTSHEMGHNFNQGHDAAGSGFIMAPSVNNTATWSPGSIAGFNSYVPGLNCLSDCPPDLPPVAAFTAEYTQICTGSLTRFTDNTTEAPNSWNWSFTGGTPASSSEQNPIVQYNSPGTYAVSLTAANNIGGNTSTQNGFITVGAGGTDFFFNEGFETGIGGFIIENPDNGITWAPITVAAARNGTEAMFMDNYDYNLIGQRDRLVSPTIDFSGRTDAMLKIDYSYTNFNNNNADSLIVSISSNDGASWLRVFTMGENGSGTLATRPATTSEFSPSSESDWCFEGNFGSGCLEIDLSGHSSATTKFRLENYNDFGNNMYIENISLISSCQSLVAPTAIFSVNDSEGCEPFTTQYFDNSEGSPTSWSWSFPGGTPATSSQQNPTVTYNTSGTYNATLTATNDIGSDSQTLTSLVTVNAGTISDFNFVVNGMTVDFTDASQNATSYSWSFGDTNTSGQINPSHTYATEGIFPVTLTVTNACGSNDITQNVTIEGMPNAIFSASGTSGCAPLSVDFSNFSSGLNSVPSWDFPGGTPATSTDENPTIVYNTPGVYSVSLTVTNSAGSDTQTQTNLIVINSAPVGGFNSVINELVVDFTTNTIPLPTSVTWDFGDTNTSIELNPTHTYAADGIYTVTFTATNDCGTITETSIVEVSLIPVAPTASFVASNVTGCEPFTVDFINQSSDNSESYNWTFEGGTPATSTDINPTVIYNTPGNYSVSLVATNEVGDNISNETNYITVNPLPSTSFTSVTNELVVDFTNTSTEATSYSWDFGDTNTSIEENPMHTYDAEGTYTVSLISTNDCGSITETMEIVVALIPVAPVAGFIASVNEGCEPFTVEFINQSSDNTENLQWTFPGGTPATSTALNPVVIYNTPGTFDVTLIASNEVGNNEAIQTNFILVNPLPNADFTPVANELDVTFGNNSQNGDTYAWDFGDTGISALENPVHTYDMEGTFTVTLTVTNDCGTDVFTEVVEVSLIPVAPTAAFTANVNEGCQPFTVEFSNQSSDNTENLNWTFPGGTPATSTDANPTVTYSTAGTFDVTLIASNEVGNNEAIQTNFILVNPLPNADFTPVANELAVTFGNNSQNGDTYAWDFGDTGISALENPVHTYDMEGTFTVTLTVTNDCGTDVFTEVVEVSLIPVAPTAAFTANVNEGCQPFTVEFSNQSSDNTENLNWTFPGGTPATSTDANPTVTYSTAGTFDVTLVASNEVGNNEAIQTNFILVNPLPNADFTPVANELEVTFNNNSQDGDTYTWEFGDTNVSGAENPIHTYDMEGTYLVTLIVSNDCGTMTFTEEVTVSLTPVAPTAAFSASETSGCAPFTVQYTSQSSANATSLLWEFAGGMPATSTDANPVVVYTSVGSFNTTLTATNEAGNGVATEMNYILINDIPSVGFSGVNNALEVSFTNATTNADTYAWDFGDTGISALENPTHTYAAAGTYTVTLTATNECGSVEMTTEVTVSLAPTAPTAAFSADVSEGCAPLTVTMTNLSSDNAESYLWEVSGPTPASSIEANPVFIFTAGGAYSITLTATNEIGEDTQTQTDFVIVNDVPVANFSSSAFGNIVNFFNNSEFGDTYLLNFGDNMTSNEENPSHEYATEGFYTVTLTVTNDCGEITWTEGVTVGAMMPMTNFFSDIEEDCVPFVVQFTDNSSNEPTSWNWTFEGGTPATSTEQNPVVTYNNPGEYDITLAAANEIGSNNLLRSEYINALDVPAASFAWTNNGLNISFSNTSEAGTSYMWNFGDGFSTTSVSPSHEYEAEGIYTVTLTAENDCGTSTFSDVLDLGSTGIGELDFLSDFNLYPNPNNGQFTLVLTGEGLGSDLLEIRLINLIGQVMNQEEVNFTGNLERTYDHRDLAAGMYFVELRAGDKNVYRKLVIE